MIHPGKCLQRAFGTSNVGVVSSSLSRVENYTGLDGRARFIFSEISEVVFTL